MLMGMCSWMGSHFRSWIDHNGVAFSLDLLEWDLSEFGVGRDLKMGRFLLH